MILLRENGKVVGKWHDVETAWGKNFPQLDMVQMKRANEKTAEVKSYGDFLGKSTEFASRWQYILEQSIWKKQVLAFPNEVLLLIFVFLILLKKCFISLELQWTLEN